MPGRMLLAVPAALVCCGLASGSCARNPPAAQAPTVELTRVPEAAEGGPDRMAPIAGRARGARPGQRIVLVRAQRAVVGAAARGPALHDASDADASFENTTHLGTEYAALLVEADYRPPSRSDELPAPAAAWWPSRGREGRPPAQPRAGRDAAVRRLRVARARRPERARRLDEPLRPRERLDRRERGAAPADRAASPDGWTCAEVILTRSLGYGTYSFVVRGRFAPAPRRRAGSLHLGRRGERPALPRDGHRDQPLGRIPQNANAQYVVQPYYVPANVSRFQAPAGTLTHTLRWEVGRASFRTVRGAGRRPPGLWPNTCSPRACRCRATRPCG